MVNMTQRDLYQIAQNEHDETLNARRVTLVGGDIFIPEVKLPDNINIDVKVIEIIKEVPVIIEKIVIKEIEKPVITEKLVEVIKEVPVYTEKIVYKEIEKPTIIKEVEFREIEKYVMVPEVKEIDKIITMYKYPIWLMIVSTLVGLSGWVNHIIK